MNEICCRNVWGEYKWHKCGKPAKFEVDGRHYCGIHNPNKALTKAQVEAESNRKFRSAKWKIESAAPDLLAALQMYSLPFTDEKEARAEFGNEAVDRELFSRAAITKAGGEA